MFPFINGNEMLGLSFDALWKTLKISKDSILVPTEIGKFIVRRGICSEIGQSALICNGIIDVELERGMYLVGVHIPPSSRTQLSFKTSEGPELKYVSSCKYLSGMNFIKIFPDLQEISMPIQTTSSSDIMSVSPATVVIIPVKWGDPSNVTKLNLSIKDPSTNTLIEAYSSLADFPVYHVAGIIPGIVSKLLAPNSSGARKIEVDATGYKGFFWGYILNGNGYCENSVKVCNSDFSFCYEVYRNNYYDNSLNVHGIDQVLLPFEDKLNLEFWSENRNNKTSTRCWFTIPQFIAYGIPKS